MNKANFDTVSDSIFQAVLKALLGHRFWIEKELAYVQPSPKKMKLLGSKSIEKTRIIGKAYDKGLAGTDYRRISGKSTDETDTLYAMIVRVECERDEIESFNLFISVVETHEGRVLHVKNWRNHTGSIDEVYPSLKVWKLSEPWKENGEGLDFVTKIRFSGDRPSKSVTLGC